MIDLRELFDDAPEGFRAKQASESEILFESFLDGMRKEDVQYQMNVSVYVDWSNQKTEITVQGLHSVTETDGRHYDSWEQFPFGAIYEFRKRLFHLKEEVDSRLGVISKVLAPDCPEFLPRSLR